MFFVVIGFNIFGEKEIINVSYGIGMNNQAFEIYLETNLKGVNVQVIYTNGSIYLNIQGMKIKFELSNINELLIWVEQEFELVLDFNGGIYNGKSTETFIVNVSVDFPL